jgi:hypothetical protein
MSVVLTNATNDWIRPPLQRSCGIAPSSPSPSGRGWGEGQAQPRIALAVPRPPYADLKTAIKQVKVMCKTPRNGALSTARRDLPQRHTTKTTRILLRI